MTNAKACSANVVLFQNKLLRLALLGTKLISKNAFLSLNAPNFHKPSTLLCLLESTPSAPSWYYHPLPQQ